MFRYLVTYAHTTGYGSLELNLPRPIAAADDLADILTYLRQQNAVDNPVILAFSRFDDPAPNPTAVLR